MGVKKSSNGVGIIKEEELEVPPGFLSRTSFLLRRLENGEDEGNVPMEVDGQPSSACQEKLNRTRQTQTEITKKHSFCSLKIDDAPVFHPSEEEFKDALKYIVSIRPVAERYGLCRIVPPASWKPPNFFEDNLTLEAESADMCSKFNCGSKFTVKRFRQHANNLKKKYFSDGCEYKAPDIEKIEAEYWRLIDNAGEGIKVLQSPLVIKASPTENFDDDCGWNLRNIPKDPGSLLPFGCYSNSTILIPKVSMASCFTSHFWKNEEHHLYSLSYIHIGEPKLWYCVPGRYCFKFMEVARKLSQSSKNPAFLNQLDIQISPSALIYEGISVVKCVQNPSEFVLVFPGAYRTEISCGFNSSEASRFAPLDWLPYGQNVIEHYAECSFKPLISQDKLLIEATIQAAKAQWEAVTRKDNSFTTQMWKNVTGKNGILTKLLKSRVRIEDIWRKHASTCFDSNAFDDGSAPIKRECSICFYDLYISGVSCSCSPNRYACLRHSYKLCSCPCNSKRFLFRYTMPELELLVQAVEGKLSAAYNWVKKRPRQEMEHSLSCPSPRESSGVKILDEHVIARQGMSDIKVFHDDVTRKYHIPPEYHVTVPTILCTVDDPPSIEHALAISRDHLMMGLRFPIHPFIKHLLRSVQLPLHRITPQSFAVVAAFLRFCADEEMEPTLSSFFAICCCKQAFTNPVRFYFVARKKFLKNMVDTLRAWYKNVLWVDCAEGWDFPTTFVETPRAGEPQGFEPLSRSKQKSLQDRIISKGYVMRDIIDR